MRRVAALFSEMTFSLAWPFAPRLLSRHASFERLRLFLFAYNVVAMTVTLVLTRQLLDATGVATSNTLLGHTVRWSEGLFRYIAWTAANFPFAAAFRRRFDADLDLANADRLAPALLFGRQIFWASLVATLAHDLILNARAYGPNAVANAMADPLAAWATGSGAIRQGVELMDHGREVLHVAAVSLFRAGAVTYALFAGANVGASVKRVVAAYCVGGFLLFSLHAAGAQRAGAGADRAMNRLRNEMQKEYAATVAFIDLAGAAPEALQFAVAYPTIDLARRRAYAAARRGDQAEVASWQGFVDGIEERIRLADAIFMKLRSSAAERLNASYRQLQRVGQELRFTYMLRHLIPYYAVCVGGAWWLMRRSRRKYRPLDGDEA